MRYQVHIDNIRKAYDGRTVLAVDSLTLNSDNAYALIGSNGSGKSTLLRILAGTSAVTSGKISATTTQGNTYQPLVGYMPQKPYVFAFSVARNVAMAIPSGMCDAQEVETRVSEALAAVGMDNLASARGNTLSGGEAQRVALARILVRDLHLVLLDEPTASMDIAGTMQVEAALADYRERTGCLMLIATHAPAQAKRIADQAIMLHEGCVVEQGMVQDVLAHPQSEEGQSFLSYWQL